MSNDFEEIKFNNGQPERLWPKRLRRVIIVLVIIIVGFFLMRGRQFTIQNKPWWTVFANVLKIGSEEKIDPFPLPSPETDRLDVLILGLRGEDRKAIEEEGGLLTDTILVASIDKTNKKAALISVPRDLYVEIAGVKGKINSVYERGLGKGKGVTVVKEVVSRLSGVRVDNVVVFDFEAFKKIVDALDGIDINLTKTFVEKDQWGYEFSLPAGQNHLSGEQALYFVRSRFSTSDFDRARRQQEVVLAIKNKAETLGYFSNPLKASGLFSELKGTIKTDFQIWDITDLLALASAFRTGSKPKTHVISTENLLYETKNGDGEYILLPKDNNYALLKDFFINIFSNNLK